MKEENKIKNTINEYINIFKNKDMKVTSKMILELLFDLLIVLLIKIPFDLIKNIGYDFIKVLSTNNLYDKLWNYGFLILYIITAICTLIIFLRNFKSKYQVNKINNI